MTRCIFCRAETHSRVPVEHIVPESLGNTQHLVPQGLVCGRCNSYFGSKVEQPFLGCDLMTHLRNLMQVPSKGRKVLPTIKGWTRTMIPIQINGDINGWEIKGTSESARLDLHLKHGSRPTIDVCIPRPALPSASVTSRFLAKMAVEAAAKSCLDYFGAITEEFFQDYGPLARHAREGHPRRWKVAARHAYAADSVFRDGSDKYQIMHEFNLIADQEQSAIYFFVRLFGVEFAIDCGCDELNRLWTHLVMRNGLSPLDVDHVVSTGTMPCAADPEWAELSE